MNEYYPKILSGYVDIGIDKASENYQKALELLEKADLSNDILCEHELRDGFARLHIVNINQLENLSIVRQQSISVGEKNIILPIKSPLTDIQKQAIKDIYSLYSNDDTLKSQNVSVFMSKWDEYDNLRKLRNWWDAIPQYYTITPVGKVLAHANAQKCDPNLPPLD